MSMIPVEVSYVKEKINLLIERFRNLSSDARWGDPPPESLEDTFYAMANEVEQHRKRLRTRAGILECDLNDAT